MARPNKYESHIKPYLQDIKDALERGVEEKKIAQSVGVSVSAWCDYKKRFTEFSEVFKRKDTSEILKQLDSALLKLALGFEYEKKKQYITTDADGKTKKHTEIIKGFQSPNVTAIFGAYNRFDPNYIKDKAYYELKQQELELKRMNAEANNFDLD